MIKIFEYDEKVIFVNVMYKLIKFNHLNEDKIILTEMLHNFQLLKEEVIDLNQNSSKISPIEQNNENRSSVYEKKSNDTDSSFENERKLYESIPNSRSNSHNRVRSPARAPLRNKVRYEPVINQFDVSKPHKGINSKLFKSYLN